MLVRACKNSKIINHKSKMKNRIQLHDTEKRLFINQNGINKTLKANIIALKHKPGLNVLQISEKALFLLHLTQDSPFQMQSTFWICRF